MILIDGKKVSAEVRNRLAEETKILKEKIGKEPGLASVLVGDDPASAVYVRNKNKTCSELGFKSFENQLSSDTTEEQLLTMIDDLNCNPNVHGILVQLPLPDQIDSEKILQAIDPKKDVDGFHPVNIGRMVLGLPCFLPATPFGIITLIENFNINTTGKRCLIIGRSDIVGTPMSILMSRNTKFANCTVTLAHSKTKNLDFLTKNSDIIIVALGKPKFLKKEMIKESTVIIDVGINRIQSNEKKSGWALVGDVDFHFVKDKASHITPVPGGVGPMTIVSLLKNTLLSYKRVIY